MTNLTIKTPTTDAPAGAPIEAEESSRIDFAVALVMVFFAVPKLLGAEASSAGFTTIGHHFSVDPTAARLFTGVVELAIAAGLGMAVASAELNRRMGARILSTKRWSTMAHIGLLGTMLGAVYTELIVRPGSAPGLLVLAVALIGAALYRLIALRPSAVSQPAATSP